MTKLRPLAAFLAAFVFVLNSALGAVPVIGTQPLGQNVNAGAAVTFSVSASGAGTLTYQWQKNGFSISAATSATYSIASAVVGDAGSYRVIVTSTVTNTDSSKTITSTTSNVALLNVGNLSIITTQPISQTVNAGASVTFSVTASDTSSSTYQWQKDNVNISGATGAFYYIPSTVALNAGNYTVLVTNSVASVSSSIATLVLNLPPEITTQPATAFVNVLGGATFSVVATGTGALSYQWQKGTTDIAGATSPSFTVNSVPATGSASYRVIVTDSLGLSTTSSPASLIVGVSAPASDGYAASALGGGSATATTVTTVDSFRSLAEDSAAHVITVSGAIDLGAAKVAVKSNKTIQGADANATLKGNLELASGVTNVIIRGLNITNPSTTANPNGYGNGDGISIVGATNVSITHCSVFDCADGLIDITAGADNVTVSWCEFYYANQTSHRYAMTVGADTGETKALRVTLHHNWWSTLVDQSMPVTTWGQIHMYNNLLTSTGNTAATKVQASAQLLSERNQYTGVKDPLVKSGTGLILVSNNVYSGTTLTADATLAALVPPATHAEAATDTVFVPSYSYEMLPPSDWTDALKLSVGNTAGSASTSPTPASATAISNTGTTTLTAGDSFELSATLTGFSDGEDVAYQWRFNNTPFPTGDKKKLTFNNAPAGQYGPYSVLILKSSGASVISTPITITVNAAATTTTATSTTVDAGGAPSVWFFAALSLVALGRRFTRRSGETTRA